MLHFNIQSKSQIFYKANTNIFIAINYIRINTKKQETHENHEPIDIWWLTNIWLIVWLWLNAFIKVITVENVLPGVIVIVALSLDVLGTDTTLTSASWCWINPNADNTLLWQFVTGKAFEIVAYLTTVVLYLSVKIHIKRQVLHGIRVISVLVIKHNGVLMSTLNFKLN